MDFLHVKIEVQIHKALAKGQTIIVNKEKVWVPMKYEKLPRICLTCGCIVHGDGGCRFKNIGYCDKVETCNQFRTWLRAYSTSSRRLQYKMEKMRFT